MTIRADGDLVDWFRQERNELESKLAELEGRRLMGRLLDEDYDKVSSDREIAATQVALAANCRLHQRAIQDRHR